MDRREEAEQLSGGSVLLDLAQELVVATGADRIRFLHGILTGDVAGTPVGGGCHAALLTPKAHVVAETRIFVRQDDLYLVVATGQGAPMVEALSKYAIMDDFAVAPRTDFGLIAILGPRAGARLTDAGYPPGELASRPAWSHADVVGTSGVLWLARVRQLGVDGYWVGGTTLALAGLKRALEQSGTPRLSADAAEAARIAACEPMWGREITDAYFPMEVGLDGAIDYTKGCFLGQEPIVRIRDRGHINWRLARLDLEGAVDPHPGDRLETDAKAKAGKVTSVARLPDGRGIALALVHVTVPAGHAVKILSPDGGISISATIAP
jgi:tRNA-modifying protein YgfZ